MKKWILVLLAIVMALSVVACGNAKQPDNPDTPDNPDKPDTPDTPDEPKEVTMTPAEIEQKIAAAIGADNYLCTVDVEEDWFKNYYGFDMTKIESYVAKQNAVAAVNPDTVIVIKTKDADSAREVAERLNTAFAQQVSYIRQYPFGVQKVVNARIFCEGNYVMYLLAGASYEGEDSEGEAKLAASEYAKIDAAVKEIFGKALTNLAVVPADDGKGGGLIPPEEMGTGDYVIGG